MTLRYLLVVIEERGHGAAVIAVHQTARRLVEVDVGHFVRLVVIPVDTRTRLIMPSA